MAKNMNFERQQQRLKLKAEQLNQKVRISDAKEKVKSLSNQLKAIGGRIR